MNSSLIKQNLRRFPFKPVSIFALLLLLLSVTFQNCSNSGFSTSAGNTSTDQNSLDSQNPDLNFINEKQLFNSPNVTINFTVVGTPSSVTCKLNSSSVEVDCASGVVTFTALIDGDYTLEINEVRSGVSVPRKKLFRVDATPPMVNSNLAAPVINFTATDNLSGIKSVQCSLNNAAFGDCTSPYNYANLPPGDYTFRILARDMADNQSAMKTHQFTVVANPTGTPSVRIVLAPPQFTNSNQTQIPFAGENVVAYECAFNNDPYSACMSPVSVPNLSEVTKTLKIRGITSTGSKTADAVASWTSDFTPPSLPVLTSDLDDSVVLVNRATFLFSSTDGLSGIEKYRCKFDTTQEIDCSSPFNLTNLLMGDHNLEVRSLDKAGNYSPVAKISWVVVSQPATKTPVNISLNDLQSCYYKSGKLYCWGKANQGFPQEPGHSNTAMILPGYESGVTDVSTNFGDKCVIKNGAVTCFGNSSNYNDIPFTSPTLSANVTSVVMSPLTNYAIIGGSVKYWPNYSTSSTVVRNFVGLEKNVSQVAAGFHHVCALKRGTVWCSGAIFGAINSSNATRPSHYYDRLTRIGNLTNIISISASISGGCALSSLGAVYCWGYNIYGMLGPTVPINDLQMNPVQIFNSSVRASAISGYNYTSCAVVDGKVLCWGVEQKGQSTNDVAEGLTNTFTSTPTEVPGLTGVLDIFTGMSTSCALQTNGVKCWGENSTGQLGNGTFVDSITPVQVLGL